MRKHFQVIVAHWERQAELAESREDEAAAANYRRKAERVRRYGEQDEADSKALTNNQESVS